MKKIINKHFLKILKIKKTYYKKYVIDIDNFTIIVKRNTLFIIFGNPYGTFNGKEIIPYHTQ